MNSKNIPQWMDEHKIGRFFFLLAVEIYQHWMDMVERTTEMDE
jgi:hypothetical protein